MSATSGASSSSSFGPLTTEDVFASIGKSIFTPHVKAVAQKAVNSSADASAAVMRLHHSTAPHADKSAEKFKTGATFVATHTADISAKVGIAVVKAGINKVIGNNS